MEPTAAEIQDLRNMFTSRVTEENKEFHPKDLARVKNDDKWISRFILHNDRDMTESLNMLIDTCEWRTKYNINDISENTINSEYLKEGSIFAHNRDKDGKLLFIFNCRKHVKGAKDMKEVKKMVIYWLERVERQDKGEAITIVFDMQDTGLSNLDMDYTKYTISLFKYYYPHFLNYILVFDMPWVLNAAFKIIKSYLPAKAVAKIKFVDKKSLKDFVDSSQALKNWGGQDTYEFSFVPESAEMGKIEENKKKVHFADGSPPIESSLSTFGDAKHDDSFSSSRLSLSDAIWFSQEGIEMSATLNIFNSSDSSLVYKVKTTAPEKFRVRPSAGVLSPGSKAAISVVLLSGFSATNIHRDKFLVMSYPLASENYDNADLNELWKNADSKKLEEHRLRCRVPSIQASPHNGTPGAQSVSNTPTSELEQKIAQLLISMNHLTDVNSKVRSDVQTLNLLVLATIFLIVFLAFIFTIFFPYYHNENGHCHANDPNVFHRMPPLPPPIPHL